MKIIVCRWVPKRFAINIFGTIWTRDASWIDRYIVNHEKIHSAQQRELLWIPFYILYFLEWIVKLAIYRNSDKAYRAISFEREAYGNDSNLNYLTHRPFFAQWRRKASCHT